MGCRMHGSLPPVSPEAIEEVKSTISANDVVLFMKGNKDQPVCGFSAAAVQMLKQAGVGDFTDINVLENRDMAFAVMEYNEWQTFPQLFVKGEFIGSTDIIRDMANTGELEDLLREKGILAAVN